MRESGPHQDDTTVRRRTPIIHMHALISNATIAGNIENRTRARNYCDTIFSVRDLSSNTPLTPRRSTNE